MDKYFSIHIDVDSPLILAKYYGLQLKEYDKENLEYFYEQSFNRALKLFDKSGIKATFFCVGSEIEQSDKIKNIIRQASLKGHEIANHTYSHPIGLSNLSPIEIRNEINKCCEVITNVISKRPVGFRAPGYDINTQVINILEEENIEYDSLAAWPLLHLMLSLIFFFNKIFLRKQIGKTIFGETNTFLRRKPFHPDVYNWKRINGSIRKLIELPLPSSLRILPYYSTFHISLPVLLRKLFMKRVDNDYIIYLLHIIDFTSFTEDNIPEELSIHPNIKIPYEKKKVFLKEILEILSLKRNNILSEKYIKSELWRN